MSQTDWDFLDDGASALAMARGVTAGVTPPSEGGSFVFGFNSKLSESLAAGLFVNLANYNPMAKGGSVAAAVQRGTGAGKTGFSPLLYCLATGNSVTDEAYILGLEDADPYHIVLRKGAINTGVPVADSSNSLRVSTDTFEWGTWLHLKLQCVVNDNGDVVLDVFKNDIVANGVDNPVWESIAGMGQFIDDALGINSGSDPLTSGYVGFAAVSDELTRRMYFDHVEVVRQLEP